MKFLDALAEQVPDWPRDDLARAFSAACRQRVPAFLEPMRETVIPYPERRVRRGKRLVKGTRPWESAHPPERQVA